MIAVEYSVVQDCFHVAPLEEVLKTNIRTSLNQIKNDYRILVLCDTYEEAQEKAKKFRIAIDNKKAKLEEE